jgi:hypothetical protein
MGVLGVDPAVAGDDVFCGGAILRVVGTLGWIRRSFFHACKGWFRAVYRGRRRIHTQRGGGSWGFQSESHGDIAVSTWPRRLYPTTSPASAGGDVVCDVIKLGFQSKPRSARQGRFRSIQVRKELVTDQNTTLFSEKDSGWLPALLYKLTLLTRVLKPGLSRFSFVGGGDFGVLGERATHPKPMENLFKLGLPDYGEMVKSRDDREHSRGTRNMDQHEPGRNYDPKLEDLLGEGNSWAMEVYKEDM